jgi:peptide deformylase
MARLPILRYPDPRLRENSQKVQVFDETLRKLVADMAETMFANNGAGLAAIQVGAPLQLFLIDAEIAGKPPTDPPVVFINPEFVSISEEPQMGEEGCLSFPGIYVPVKRGVRVQIKATDLEGKTFTMDADALFARALQHEHDHLKGRLLIDNVGPVKREIIKRKMKKEALAEADGSTAS